MEYKWICQRAEIEKLEQAKQAFKIHTLSKHQEEFIKGKLNDKAWKAMASDSVGHKRTRTHQEMR